MTTLETERRILRPLTGDDLDRVLVYAMTREER